MTQWFLIYDSDATMERGKNYTLVRTDTEMTLDDVASAIMAYDRLRKNRSAPRRARYAKTQEDLARAFKRGLISRSTYYRRLHDLGLPPTSPND